MAAALLIGTSILTAGCGGPPAPPADTDRGRIVESEHLRTFSPADVKAELTAQGFDTGAVRFGVDTYRLVYRTIDTNGRATTASGLLALPRNDQDELAVVAYEHGTLATKSDVASIDVDSGAGAATLSYAAAGFATAAPDYLGLGLGPGLHPYMDVPSETTASVDMLRAARAQTARGDRQLRSDVYITGFSQGGPAAMGLARALQDGADDDFRPAAVAAISGPFDLRTAELPALLDHRLDPLSSALYSAYFLVSWNRLHGVYRSPGEVFRAPYDSTVEQLFDGMHSSDELAAGIAPDIDRLLTPHAADLLRAPTGTLAAALTTSDSTCSDWTPRMPVRLYTGARDRDVATENSAHCRNSLQNRGVDAPIIDVGDVDHSGSGIRGTASTVRWFSELSAVQ